MMDELKKCQRLEVDIMDYKGILLHNAEHNDTHVVLKVPFSRYKKILTDYKTARAIFIEGAIENYINNYKYYILTNLSGLDIEGNPIKTNSYKVIKTKELEIKGKCEGCDCNKKRWINPRTQNCYYREMITKDYTTKIKNK